jgi:hypothetical protein
VYDTLESLPLRIRRSKAKPEESDAFIQAVDAMPEKPLFWFADKEFATEPYLRRLLPWCNKNRVVLMIPMPKWALQRRKVLENWHNGTARPAYNNGKTLYWWAQPHRFNAKANSSFQKMSPPFTWLTLYYEGKPGEDDGHSEEVVISQGDELYAVCFLVNVEVTQENVAWLAEQYGFRWATENVFKRAKAYTGASFSPGMFARHLAYVGAMLSLSAYALWRMARRLRLKLRVHDPQLSHVRFFSDLHSQSKERLLGLDAPPTGFEGLEAPPGPFVVPRKKRRQRLVEQPQSQVAVASYV